MSRAEKLTRALGRVWARLMSRWLALSIRGSGAGNAVRVWALKWVIRGVRFCIWLVRKVSR